VPSAPSSNGKFTYKFGSKTVTLPKFDMVPIGVARKLRALNGVEQMFGYLEAVATEAELAKIDTMPSVEFHKMLAAWQQNSGVTPGES
jgi:hypothetical protein